MEPTRPSWIHSSASDMKLSEPIVLARTPNVSAHKQIKRTINAFLFLHIYGTWISETLTRGLRTLLSRYSFRTNNCNYLLHKAHINCHFRKLEVKGYPLYRGTSEDIERFKLRTVVVSWYNKTLLTRGVTDFASLPGHKLLAGNGLLIDVMLPQSSQ